MNNARSSDDMRYGGSGLHKLSGNLADFYAVKVSGNYRIVFRFVDDAFFDVDYVDYH